MNKYYVDTSIWRDLHENRSDGVQPLGDFAFQFFQKVQERCDIIIYSDMVLEELGRAYTDEEIKELFSKFSESLEYVKYTIPQIIEAVKMSKIYSMSFGDAMHTILARNSSAILITRGHHFRRIKHVVTVKLPEEIL